MNAGIPSDFYLGERLELKYPSVDSLAALMLDSGRGCLMFKVDLKRAYIVPICTMDYLLLGLSWKGQCYVDVRVPFGARIGAMVCQRCTTAVAFMYKQLGFSLVSYLDDLGSAVPPDQATSAFKTPIGLLQELGLEEAMDKRCDPCTRMVFLGIMFDSNDMAMEIPADKARRLLLYSNHGRERKLHGRRSFISFSGSFTLHRNASERGVSLYPEC